MPTTDQLIHDAIMKLRDTAIRCPETLEDTQLVIDTLYMIKSQVDHMTDTSSPSKDK